MRTRTLRAAIAVIVAAMLGAVALPSLAAPGTTNDPGELADGPALEVDLASRSLVRSITDPASDQATDQALTFPHAISDRVYGLNFGADSLRAELGIGVNRWGGNGVERYSHLTGDSNKGHDYFFMTDTGAAGSDDAFERANRADGTETLLTVPLIGWVSEGPPACSYPVDDHFGPEHNATPMDQVVTHWADGNVVCGNGYRNGELVSGPHPSLTSRAVDAGFVGDWVESLVGEHGTAADGGVEGTTTSRATTPSVAGSSPITTRSAPSWTTATVAFPTGPGLGRCRGSRRSVGPVSVAATSSISVGGSVTVGTPIPTSSAETGSGWSWPRIV